VTNFDRCQLAFTVLQEHAKLHFQSHVTVFDQCQLALPVLQALKWHNKSHVMCLLQFLLLQLSKFNLPNDEPLNYILMSRDCF